MQLFSRIGEAAQTLPPQSRDLHQPELMQRHHAVDLSITGTVASVCDAIHNFPQHQWGSMQLSGDRVLVCHGGHMRQDATLSIPYYMPQADFVNTYLASAPNYLTPCISRTVYPIAKAGSTVDRSAMNVYLSNGAWMQVMNDGYAKFTHGSAVLHTVVRRKPHLTLQGKYGMHAMFLMHEEKQPAQPAVESQDVVQPQEVEQTLESESVKAASEGEVRVCRHHVSCTHTQSHTALVHSYRHVT